MTPDLMHCPNCDSRMNAGDACPECDHDDRGDCTCAYCEVFASETQSYDDLAASGGIVDAP